MVVAAVLAAVFLLVPALAKPSVNMALYVDATLKVSDKHIDSLTAFGIEGTGDQLTVQMPNVRITGNVESTYETDGDVVYKLKDLGGNNGYFGWKLEGTEVSVFAPKGATKDNPYGRWGFVIKGRRPAKQGTYPWAYSVVLNYNADGTGKLEYVNGWDSADKDASAVSWADVLSGDYQPYGDAAAQAAKDKQAFVSGAEFTWEGKDTGNAIAWKTDKPLRGYTGPSIRVVGK